MELWWIILAGCGGGLLLVAYVAVVMYKIFRRKKRVQMNQAGDPKRLPDDKDWATHADTSAVSERTEDGLCIDTKRGSTKIRRKASTVLIPNAFVSEIPGTSDAVLQSVQSVTSPKINPANTQNGPHKTAIDGKASTGQKSPLNEESKTTNSASNSPDLVQRSEYTWETLVRQPRDVKENQSQSFNGEFDKRRDQKITTRSLKLKSDEEGRRFVRSKSFKGYTQRELAMLSAEEMPPLTKVVVSVKRGGENKKRTSPRESEKDQSSDADTKKKISVKSTTAEKSTKINRSGSAPSMTAKEKVVKNAEEIIKPRTKSYTWIPEPDYQSVSIEEVVSATKEQNKVNREDQVCIVEIHNKPNDPDSQVSSSAGNETKMIHATRGVSNEEQSREEQNDLCTIIDIVDIGVTSSGPGVAKRVTTVIDGDSPNTKVKEETEIPMESSIKRELSVRNRVQNLEDTITPELPVTQHDKTSTTEGKNANEASLPSGTDNNSSVQILPSSYQKPSATKVITVEATVHNVPNGHPPFTTKPSEVRSIGKLTIIKNVDMPYNQRIQDSRTSIETASSILTRQSSNGILMGNGRTPLGKTEELHQKKTSPMPPPVPYLIQPRASSQTQDTTKITILSKDNLEKSNAVPQLTSAEVLQRALQKSVKGNAGNLPPSTTTPTPTITSTTAKEADTELTLEEKKKIWKREQIVDQLHNARTRNENQNFVFGTGLAYQSCMPELQNRLKQLTLAK